MSKFKKAVIGVVKLIPWGRVVSYGQVAIYVGVPRAARQVGWILNGLDGNPSTSSGWVPWWRVVNNQGRISIKGSKYTAHEQKELLLGEGVKVARDYSFEIEKYRFIPDYKFLRALKLDPDYLEIISNELPYSKYYFKG